MFDNLSERLERSFKILKGEGKITEINVAETLKDVRRALLDADVNYKVAKTFTDTVKQKALGQNVLTAVKPSQLMVKIVHDELTQLMGGETVEIDTDGHPAVILMSGLQGSGKTTFSGKLARITLLQPVKLITLYVICHFCLKLFLIPSVSACDILLYSHGRKKCIVLKKIADLPLLRFKIDFLF